MAAGPQRPNTHPTEQTIDTARLTDHLRPRLPSFRGPIALEPLTGGQSNPTYVLHTGDRRYVLRRKPPGPLLPSAHAVEREFRVMAALAGSGVPVPRMHHLCEDTSIIGTSFYLMDFVEGRVFRDPALPGMPGGERAAVYDELNRVIAALHRVDVTAAGTSAAAGST